MLDACPHHHEDEAEKLDGLTLRTPRTSQGKRMWRSLDELAQTPDFLNMMHREFPHAASEWTDEPSRRNFLKLMSASLALGGLTACTLQKTPEKILPYVNPPEEVIPGRPLFFATSAPWCGYAKGVVVESHEGRPTKIEGNAEHPSTGGYGGTDIWMQASVLDMYDPDRSQTVMHGYGNVSTWGAFTDELSGKMAEQQSKGGAGLRFLTGTVTSPTVARQIQGILKKFPQAKWHQWEAVGRHNARDGALRAFGQDVQAVYRLDQAKVILSLDSNFLLEDPGSLAYAKQFIDGRRVRRDRDEMNRLYTVESGVTITGAMADHRLALRSSEIESLAQQLAGAINGTAASGPNAKWVNAVAKDLQANRGHALVLVGESQPASVHALGYAINDALGAAGSTVVYVDPIETSGPDGPHTLEELVSDINGGTIDLLVILGTNPSFTAYSDMGFVSGAGEKTPEDRTQAYNVKNPLSKVKTVVHHGTHFDETAFFSHWHIPASHYLESWGDLRSYDGTASIVQPLILPLYSSKSDVELLAFLDGDANRGAYDIVRETWQSQMAAPYEATWAKSLEKGVIDGSAAKPKQVALKTNIGALLGGATTQPATAGGLELVFRPDPHIWDGRFANNGWLQELPKPITLLTWDNAALMGYNTARKLGVIQNDPGRATEASMIEIKHGSTTLRVPALVVPGHAEDAITLHLGYGRSRAGNVGNGKGVNAYDMRTRATPWVVAGVEVNLTGDMFPLATSQSHHLMEVGRAPEMDKSWMAERELFHVFTRDEFAEKLEEYHKAQGANDARKLRTIELPLLKHNPDEEAESMLPNWDYSHNKWGMVIDNNACIGCNACVIACQSENNIPVVGKEQVLRGREMHWLRIDTYWYGKPEEAPDVYFQPITCMHCETAPCTLVCPVEATSISAEDINEQTYNRCVGTRYCSNNCPYKVRRFNFLYYNDYKTPSLMLQRNPNVTVRSRGIMEKCSYCVQRVNNGRIEAKKQDRLIAPGEVRTACEQSCPTQAIMFGNLNDPRWDATKLQDEPHRYTLLDELNTKPRTSYLSRLKNPNPELVGSA
ncbi:MAG TPA: TAT-variant-translocated molybdopterin oxidoreductase [Tepidisphaeraceae bacterium]|nr:TAT-variant-translocated molybdopterin oxidoreductase [Tepidisphaeraceae bacterium]